MAPTDTPAVRRRRAPTVLVALVPVAAVIAVDPAGRSPFVAAKWWAVSTLVWLVALLVRRTAGTPPEPSLVQRALAVLVVWLGLTSLTGMAPAAAWLGSGERTYGWFTWATVLVALGTGMRLHRLDAARGLLLGLAAAHVAAALWCGLELLGLEPISVSASGDRLLGPFGSAAITASALLLLAPGGTAAGWSLRHDPHRPTAALGWLAVSAAPLSLVALGATGTRGAWLAAACTLLAVVALGGRRTTRRQLGAVAAVVAVIALGSIGVADRLGDLFERSPGGGAGRLDEWHAALGVIGDHPVLGVGPEGYPSAVVAHLDDHYARTYGRTVLVDRAHSGPLDVAAIGGLPALVTWLVVLVAIGAVCARAIRRRTGPWAAVAVGVVAYLVAQLVLFGVAPLDPVLALVVGALIAEVPGAPLRSWPRPRWHHGVLAGALGLGVAVSAAAGATHVLADRALQRAVEADAATAAGHARAATSWRPDLTAAWVVRAELALRSGDGVAALAAADDGLRWAPHDPVLRLAKGRVLTLVAARDLEPDSARRAVEWLIAVADGDPSNPAVHLSLGQAHAVAGNADDAVRSFERAAALDPDDTTALVAAARVEVSEGRISDARRHVRQALDRDPTDPAALALWDEPGERRRDGREPNPDLVRVRHVFASVDAAAMKRSPEPIPPADGEELVVQPTVRLGSGRSDFAAFYEQHHPRVARALAVTLGDAELATEATDEAMVRAYQRWKQVSSLDNPGGWVYRVGLNWSRSVLRRRRVARRHVQREIHVEQPVVGDPAVAAALADLHVDQRAVVVCRHLLGWSEQQTAEALGLPAGTVKSRLHRARRELEQRLDHLDPRRTS